jgi:hypothetical protein
MKYEHKMLIHVYIKLVPPIDVVYHDIIHNSQEIEVI